MKTNFSTRILSNTDPLDTVTMDVPFLMRVLELCRESLKTDVQLHDLVTAILKCSKESPVLNMAHYEHIVKNLDSLERQEGQPETPSEEY